MGYELNQLMRRYGVATPTMVQYAGAKPDANAAQAAADRAAYNKYVSDYQDRLSYTPAYSAEQYQTRPSAGAAAATAEGGIGMDQYYKNIRDTLSQSPSGQDMRAQMQKYGISGYDAAQARGGSMFGSPLGAPVYAPVTTTTTNTGGGGTTTTGGGTGGATGGGGPGGGTGGGGGTTNTTDGGIPGGGGNAGGGSDYIDLNNTYGGGDILNTQVNNVAPNSFTGTTVPLPGTTIRGPTVSGDGVMPNFRLSDLNINPVSYYGLPGATIPGVNVSGDGYMPDFRLNDLSVNPVGPPPQINVSSQWEPNNAGGSRSVFGGASPFSNIASSMYGGFNNLNSMSSFGSNLDSRIAGGNYTLPPLTFTPSFTLPPLTLPKDPDEFEELKARGGEVKGLAKKYKVKTNFFDGGFNDLSGMMAGDDAYAYGAPPGSGPLGSWLEKTAMEVVPGLGVSGGARTPERNREVGGVPDSYHITDNARDFRPPANMTQSELLSALKSKFGPDFDVLASKGRSVHVEPGPNFFAKAPQTDVALNTAAAADASAMGAPSETAPNARQAGLMAMLKQYGPGQSVYAPELKIARERATAESNAFANMLQKALVSPEDAQSSKAEMYFRLAAAFGSPTRTGQFTENLALAGKEMADYSKGQRESGREKLALRLKAQELRSGAAKEELSSLRALAGEEMKDRRAMATQMIKEYIESGQPQSAAGKQAQDEGLAPGTPAFQKRVSQISELNVEQKMAQINALIGNLTLAQQNQALKKEQSGKLTPAEVELKRSTEDSLASIDNAMNLISQAYKLNPNTFDNSTVDFVKRKALEAAGSKDPKLLNTRTLEGLLKNEMITSASEKLKGVLSDSDIKLLQDVQGLDAKSVEERANILRTAYARLKSGKTRQQRRLEDITSGMYGRISGGTE